MHTRNHTCESDNSELFTRQLSTFLFFTEFSLSCENIARLHQFFLLCWYGTLLSFGKNQCWHQGFSNGYCQLIGCGLMVVQGPKQYLWHQFLEKKNMKTSNFKTFCYVLNVLFIRFLFHVFGHFWRQQNYENRKILHNLSLHFAR